MKFNKAFSGFSVNNIQEAKKFYKETLGFDVEEKDSGLKMQMDGSKIFVYEKPDHTPATFTILNFPVENIEQAVEDLSKRGVRFEQYDGQLKTDAKGIHRQDGMNVAWFKDPAGNYLSLVNGEM